MTTVNSSALQLRIAKGFDAINDLEILIQRVGGTRQLSDDDMRTLAQVFFATQGMAMAASVYVRMVNRDEDREAKLREVLTDVDVDQDGDKHG